MKNFGAILTSLALVLPAHAITVEKDLGAVRWPTVGELREEHTPEQEAELRKLVWMTPLGLLVRDYLFTTGNPRHVNRLANRITYRMFSSGPLVLGRRTALNLMKRDLYETDQVDQRVLLRYSQLESDIELKKASVEEKSTNSLAYRLVMPVLLGALWGVPPVRRQGLRVAEKVISTMNSWRSEEGAAAMLTYAKYAAEGSGAVLGGYLFWYNFISTGDSHGDGLVRRYFNKYWQTNTSIEYL